MRCDEIKGLIVEYIDGELSETMHKDIAGHLDTCPSCKRIEQSLRRDVIEPLQKAKKVEAPERIWYKLRDVLVTKKERRYLPYLIADWINYLRIRRLRLIPAAAMITVALLIAVLFFGRTLVTQNMLNAYMQEQIQFLYLPPENGEESYFGIDDVSLGTSIEKYLL